MNAIGRLRHAIGRHAQLADCAIAMGVFAATAVTTYADHASSNLGDRTVALPVAALACAVLIGRRRHPVAVLALSAVAAEVFLAQAGGARGALILLAPLIALFTVADQVELRRVRLIGGGLLAALATAHAPLLHSALLGAQNVAFIALGGLAIAAGDASRNRRAYLTEIEARAARAELDREQDAQRRIAAERLRIARDLHDAVGHQLALISVQSNVAGQAIDGDAAAAREAIAHVKSASRKALGELRDTIGLLRQPGDPVAPTAIPAPGLEALKELLASLRASGLEVDHRTEGTVVRLTPAADLTAYRVLQESLTNVYKHSRLRKARLTLSYERDELRITVVDSDPDPDATGPGREPGHGILGMRERVLALGGRFTAGPLPNGTFQVFAALPHQGVDLDLEDPR